MTNTSPRESGSDAPRLVALSDLQAAVVRGEQVPMSGIRDFYDTGYSVLAGILEEQGVRPLGPALAHHLRPPTETIDTELGFVTDRPVEPAQQDGTEVVAATIPGGEAAQLTHVGSYDGLGESWERLSAWIAEQGRSPGERSMEEYLTEPAPDADPKAMRTRLTIFLVE